jgi:N4-gp56 family major capsid protein
MANEYNGSVYGNGSNSTNGANNQLFYLDRKAIEVALNDLIFARFIDARSIPQKTGKQFRVKRWNYILDDRNVNNQGLDAEGNVIGNSSWVFNNLVYATQTLANTARTAWIAANPGQINVPSVVQIVTGGGNSYGSSRDVAVVTSLMPTLNEGAGKVNRVGVTSETLSCELQQYGNFIEYNDQVELFSESNIQYENREKLARMSAEVSDDLIQLGMLNAAGVQTFPGMATSIATVGASDADHRATYNIFRKNAKILKINLAEKNTDMISGSVKIGTTPINASYYALCSPDVKYDLESIEQFKPVQDYGYSTKVPKDEVGLVHETRLIETNRMMKYAGAGATVGTNTSGVQETGGKYDVFPILYPTKGSYASVGLQGKGKVIFKAMSPGEAKPGDPYGNKGTFSYQMYFAGIALQPEKLLVTYVTASA